MILPSVGPTPSLLGILAAIGQCIGTFDARDGKAMEGTAGYPKKDGLEKVGLL